MQYLADHNNLQNLVANFDPLADDRQPGITPAANGAAALVNLRQQTAADWNTFVQSVNVLFDGLITALGHPEMASRMTPIRVPDTEISLFTDSTGVWVETIMIESPEPLPWQRIWRWIRLINSSNQTAPLLILWNADGTRGLLAPLQKLVGNFNLSVAFQGNIGAEAPCITQHGNSLTESVPAGSIRMGTPRVRVPVTPVVPHPRAILDQAPHLDPILQILEASNLPNG